MKTKWIVLTVLVVLGLIIGYRVLSANSTPPGLLPGAVPSSLVAEGSIASVDSTKLILNSPAKGGKEKAQVVEMVIDPNETVVMQGGHVTQTGQLESGQKVKVRYNEKKGVNVAGVIEITDPLPMPERAQQEAPTPNLGGLQR